MNTQDNGDSVCFWTTGEAMVRMARDFVLEDKYDLAIEILTPNGFPLEFAEAILRGEKSLEGDSRDEEEGIHLIDQDPDCEELQKYLETKQFQDDRAREKEKVDEERRARQLKNIEKIMADNEAYAAEIAKPEDEQSDLSDAEIELAELKARNDLLKIEKFGSVDRADRAYEYAKDNDLLEEDGRLKEDEGTYFKKTDHFGDILRHLDNVDDSPENIQRIRERLFERAEEVGSTIVNLETDGGYKFTVPMVCISALAENRRNKSNLILKGHVELALNMPQLGHWHPESPKGMKMLTDDPYHTDVMICADVDLGYSGLSEEVNHTLYDYMDGMESLKNGEISFKALSNPRKLKTITGKVTQYVDGMQVDKDMILYVKTADPDYVPLLTQVKAIITKYGGKVAHLAVVAREQNCPMIQSSRFVVTDDEIQIDFLHGTIYNHG